MKDASHPRRRYPRPMKATPRLLGLAVSSVGAILVPAFTTVAQAQVGSTPAPLVQSTFSLVEPFDAVAPPEFTALAVETQGALMLTSALTLTETTAAINATPPLSERWQLCGGEAFEEQPTAAFCAGTLVAPDLVLTAEHCVPDARSCEALSVVFDYRYTSAGVMAPLERDDVYACTRILDADGTGDYALMRLDRAVVGREPAQPRITDPATCFGVYFGDQVWAAGFPSGVPLKLDVGDVEAGVALGAEVKEQNVSNRRFFLAHFDLFAGMDGGGVFNVPDPDEGDDIELVGFLSSGRADYARTDQGCFAAVSVDDGENASREYAGHVIQPLMALCNGRADEYGDLCPTTVGRCPPGNVVMGEDAGMSTFPPSQGCGCRVPSHGAPLPRAGLGLMLGFLLVLGTRARRRRTH